MYHCSIIYSSCYFLLTFLFFLIHRTYAAPSLKLTISPDNKYIDRDSEISISCELRDPADSEDKPVLYYVDPRTKKRTAVTRALLNGKGEKQDIPDLFLNNQDRERYKYEGKNRIKIIKAQLIDRAAYECECPDCAIPPTKDRKEFFVTKYVDPILSVTPNQLVEGDKATLRCQVDEFYPFTSLEILIHHHTMKDKGEMQIVNDSKNVFGHNLKWNASIPVQADWHEHTFQCIVKQGEQTRRNEKKLSVLFSPRFSVCHEKQHIDHEKNDETNTEPKIECSYTGNPKPQIEWYKANNEKLIDDYNKGGISIKEESEPFGVYKSIVKFDRQKLAEVKNGFKAVADPNEVDSNKNYFQKLINQGFLVRLNPNNLTKIITIVATEKEAANKQFGNNGHLLLARLNYLCLLGSLLLFFKIFV